MSFLARVEDADFACTLGPRDGPNVDSFKARLGLHMWPGLSLCVCPGFLMVQEGIEESGPLSDMDFWESKDSGFKYICSGRSMMLV